MWHSPSHTAIKTMSALSDCSIMLYIMTERWSNIKRYRDAFEVIKRTVLDLMADGKHQPKPAVMGDVFSGLQDFDFDMIGDINRDDLEQMFGDLTNEGMQLTSWNDVGMDMYDPLNPGNDIMDPQLGMLNESGAGAVTEWEGTSAVTEMEGASSDPAGDRHMVSGE
jgi:hypothetical protein